MHQKYPSEEQVADKKYIRVDFHTHTCHSSDSLTTPEKLIRTAIRKKIDRIVITDHNEITGALLARDIDPKRVIVGSEIETAEGEILGIFMTEAIPSGLSPIETIGQLRDQNAFISISHPFDPTRKGGWSKNGLLKIIHLIDAIETFNARCLWPGYNWAAEEFAREHKILGTHGSDAHAAFEIGRGSLLLPHFDDAYSLKDSLSKSVSPQLTISAPWVRFASRYAAWVKKKRGNYS
jgi:predicted metal-dependent phosphoesterase TrpH